MSSSPSPIKRRTHGSPLRKDLGDDDFSDMPAYTAPVRAYRGGKLRGRYGIEEIAKIVGSKRFRDIKRSGNFMPGQFDKWNENKKGGNGKYWGGYEDLDEDGFAHEFVVRRGGENGPLVAVNGYTTKQSDWGARRLFYEKHSTREERRGKTPKTFMRDEYYKPTYDGRGYITEWTIKPGYEPDGFNEWNMYNNYIPKDLSPYQAINRYIVMPALETYLAKQGKDKKTYIAANGGVGVLSRITSNVYDELVRAPVKAYLLNNGAYEMHEANFKQTKKGRETTNYEVDLEKYVFSKKDAKDVVRQYVANKVLPKAGELVAQYAEVIDEYKNPYEASVDDLDI